MSDQALHFLLKLLLYAPPLLLGLTLHELAHGYTAFRLGDPTAKAAGRLTLNPIKHLDILGVLAFVFLKVGWAKPVPVNPNFFRNPPKDMLVVALAGPLANLALALISAILLNGAQAMMPIAPNPVQSFFLLLCLVSVQINVMLAVFNLLPIPPLDGSRILMGLLPPRTAASYARLEPYGFLVVLVLFYMGLIGKVILPIVDALVSLLVG